MRKNVFIKMICAAVLMTLVLSGCSKNEKTIVNNPDEAHKLNGIWIVQEKAKTDISVDADKNAIAAGDVVPDGYIYWDIKSILEFKSDMSYSMETILEFTEFEQTKAESALTEDYLKSLINQDIAVSGVFSTDGSDLMFEAENVIIKSADGDVQLSFDDYNAQFSSPVGEKKSIITYSLADDSLTLISDNQADKRVFLKQK